jgi:hypothetical protein
MPILLAPLFCFRKLIVANQDIKWHLLLLGVLPLLVYCLPLLNFIWLSNCIALPGYIRYYYRISYSSLFWLPVAFIMYQVSLHIHRKLSNLSLLGKRGIIGVCFTFCLIGFIGLGQVRSAPVYGKLPFITVDSAKWWSQWQPMITSLMQQGDQPVLTDLVTSTVLRAVGMETVSKRFDHRFGKIDIEQLLAMNPEEREALPVGALVLLLDSCGSPAEGRCAQTSDVPGTSVRELMVNVATAMAKQSGKEEKKYRYRCLINLHGFTPSWVPEETGHWSVKWAQPSLIYEYRGKRGKDMEQLLRDNPPANCTVYF